MFWHKREIQLGFRGIFSTALMVALILSISLFNQGCRIHVRGPGGGPGGPGGPGPDSQPPSEPTTSVDPSSSTTQQFQITITRATTEEVSGRAYDPANVNGPDLSVELWQYPGEANQTALATGVANLTGDDATGTGFQFNTSTLGLSAGDQVVVKAYLPTASSLYKISSPATIQTPVATATPTPTSTSATATPTATTTSTSATATPTPTPTSTSTSETSTTATATPTPTSSSTSATATPTPTSTSTSTSATATPTPTSTATADSTDALINSLLPAGYTLPNATDKDYCYAQQSLIGMALNQYDSDHETRPANFSLQDLVTAKLIPAVPDDPGQGANTSGNYVLDEFAGVTCKVHGSALDGTSGGGGWE